MFALIFASTLIAAEPTPAESNVARAEAVVAAMSQGKFDAASADFTDEMKKALPPDKLKTVWESVVGHFGAFQRVTGSRTEKRDKFDIVYVTCQFEKSSLDMRLVYSADKKLGGLQFVPTKSAIEYKSPIYVHADRFQSRNVTVGAGTEWELPGTLSVPTGDGPFPAVVLVHGSGPNDRDETIGPNKPFRDLAEGLASRGIAVLRYEKRTRQHGGKLMSIPVGVKEEVLDDALAAAELLRQTPGIDPKRVYIVGHSLGALLAPKLATLDPKLAGIVVMSGNVRPLEDLILEQVTFLSKKSGEPDAVVLEKLKQLKEQVDRVKDPKLSKDTPASDLPLGIPAAYWLSMRGYNSAATAAGLSIPVLVLSGERDYQVPAADYELWQKALKDKSTATLKRYPGLNHLFLMGKGEPNAEEYQKEGHVAEDVIADIAAWIAKH